MEGVVVTQNPPVRLLKAVEVAEVLNVSRAFAYKLMRQGEIPSIRIGRSVRVRQQDLFTYIDNNVEFSESEFVLK